MVSESLKLTINLLTAF